jgi:hypothetical protein
MGIVRGVVRNGVVEPLDELRARDGTEVTILVPQDHGGRGFRDFAGAWSEGDGDDEMWDSVIRRTAIPPRARVELG